MQKMWVGSLVRELRTPQARGQLCPCTTTRTQCSQINDQNLDIPILTSPMLWIDVTSLSQSSASLSHRSCPSSTITIKQTSLDENSLAVQQLGLHAFTPEGSCSLPGQGTKIPQAAQHGQKQINQKTNQQTKQNKKTNKSNLLSARYCSRQGVYCYCYC